MQPEGPFKQSNSPSDVVLRWVEPIKGAHRNWTGDNWFSSCPLFVKLLNTLGLTYVSSLRKNKAEVPKEFLPNKHRRPCSSYFGFQEKISSLSYCPKKNKAVSRRGRHGYGRWNLCGRRRGMCKIKKLHKEWKPTTLQTIPNSVNRLVLKDSMVPNFTQ